MGKTLRHILTFARRVIFKLSARSLMWRRDDIMALNAGRIYFPEKVEESSGPLVPKKAPETERERRRLPGHTHRTFSAFMFYPDHIDFETREKEEKVILLLRQHVIVNLRWILVTTVLLFVPSVITYFGILSALPTGYVFVITMGWYLLTMAYAIEGFLGWYFNVYIVTNLRVIDIDFYNLIDKKVSDASIDKIQDISYTNFGVFRLLFNFGDVFVQTAAEVSEFDFLAVPDPQRVVKIIDDLKEQKK